MVFSTDIVVIDYETEMTGDYGDPVPRVIEIGMVRMRRDMGMRLNDYSMMVDPGRPVLSRPKNLELPISGMWPNFGALLPEIECFCRHAQMAAWPSSFEHAVTANECQRIGRKFPFDRRIIDIRSICLMALMNLGLDWCEGSQDEITYLFNMAPNTGRHRALPDANHEAALLAFAMVVLSGDQSVGSVPAS
jgi:DNA polymerase III epsilon subunit-like protein